MPYLIATNIMRDRQSSNTNKPLEYEDFTCPLCFRTIVPDRPPIYNPENCSCVEEALATGPRPDFEHPSYSPESYASSSLSTPCLEGPENEKPNQPTLTVTHFSYLPLCPAVGLNEREHRRSSSFRSNMSYQLRRFLVEQEEREMAYSPPIASPAQPRGRWLPQDVQIQSSRLVAKSSKRSEQSKRSTKSSGSSGSYEGYGGDPMVGMGSWDEGSGSGGEGYALEMSGVSEFGYRE